MTKQHVVVPKWVYFFFYDYKPEECHMHLHYSAFRSGIISKQSSPAFNLIPV